LNHLYASRTSLAGCQTPEAASQMLACDCFLISMCSATHSLCLNSPSDLLTALPLRAGLWAEIGHNLYREFFNAYPFLPWANRIVAFRITDVWTHLWLRQQQ
jgi:hypothetical protein